MYVIFSYSRRAWSWRTISSSRLMAASRTLYTSSCRAAGSEVAEAGQAAQIHALARPELARKGCASGQEEVARKVCASAAGLVGPPIHTRTRHQPATSTPARQGQTRLDDPVVWVQHPRGHAGRVCRRAAALRWDRLARQRQPPLGGLQSGAAHAQSRVSQSPARRRSCSGGRGRRALERTHCSAPCVLPLWPRAAQPRRPAAGQVP